MGNNAQIILYHPEGDSRVSLEVRLEDETVWLSQLQMAELFLATKQNISLHVNNIFKEKELARSATVKESLTVQTEGGRRVKRKVLYYNLDVIISVGYRVRSLRGTQFRIWANGILKEYMLRGYALNRRLEHIESKLHEHDKQFDLLIQSALLPIEGVFYDGQVFDARRFVSDLIRSARQSIILIDNYVDDMTLSLLAKKKDEVEATIYTSKLTDSLRHDAEKFNDQYGGLQIMKFSKSHDRFLIIDQTDIYHIGASLKDLGKKWFAFSKIEWDASDILDRIK